jgi:hypothetical protein
VKAITLRQPWASLVHHGLKTIETRTHDRLKALVNHRFAIHAGKGFDHRAMGKHYLSWLKENGADQVAFHLMRAWMKDFPSGIVLCTMRASCMDFRSKDSALEPHLVKAACCDVRGMHLLHMREKRSLEKPFPWTGRQGIFEIPDELFDAHALHGV